MDMLGVLCSVGYRLNTAVIAQRNSPSKAEIVLACFKDWALRLMAPPSREGVAMRCRVFGFVCDPFHTSKRQEDLLNASLSHPPTTQLKSWLE